MNLNSQKSKPVSGRLAGASLAEFEKLQQDEGYTQSETLAVIVAEWVKFKAGAPAPARYASVDPARFNLALGTVVELSRSIQGAQKALRAPRPILPDDEAEWRKQMDAANRAFASVDTVVGELLVTEKLLPIEKPDPDIALALATLSYRWTGRYAEQYRRLLLSLLRPFIGDVLPPPSPLTPPKVSSSAGVPSTNQPPRPTAPISQPERGPRTTAPNGGSSIQGS